MRVSLATPAERELAFAIRRAVFIDEQGVPEAEEYDAHDQHCAHLLAWNESGQAVGTARLRSLAGWAKFERIAVLQAGRGTGAGKALMQALISLAGEQGLQRYRLNAQCQALAFYEPFGFVAVGPVFDDAGIPHRSMEASALTSGTLIRPALPADAPVLTDIAFAAKRHWDYPEDWIRQWRDQLTLLPEQVEALSVWKAEREGEILAWCALGPGPDAQSATLEHCWVEPQAIGQGIGRELMAHALSVMRCQGIGTLSILSDPHAEGFYLRLGAAVTGSEPSTVPGRSLPRLELKV